MMFSSTSALTHHQSHNQSCINIVDTMSIIGPQNQTIQEPKRQKRLRNPHHRYLNVDIYQSNPHNNLREIPFINDQSMTDHSTHHPLEASFTSDRFANATISLSMKSIRAKLNTLKQHHGYFMSASPTFHKMEFLLNIMKQNKEWNNKVLKAPKDTLFHTLKNYIYHQQSITGTQSISGLKSPFYLNDISDADIYSFINIHNSENLNNIDDERFKTVYESIDVEYSFDFRNLYNDNESTNSDTHSDDSDSDNSIDNMSDDDNESVETGNIDGNQSELELEESVHHFCQSAQRERGGNTSVFEVGDHALMELFDLLHKASAPLYLFDEITQWAFNHRASFQNQKLKSRSRFMKSIFQKTYGSDLSEALQPIVENHVLPQSRSTIKITRFSFEAKLATLLLNDDLMKPENLLLDPNDPYSPIKFDTTSPYDDLNSGWWHKETSDEICTNPTEILLPIIFFIDAGKVTHRMSVEPLTFTLGIFNRSTRNNVDAWRTLGYVEDLDNSDRSQKKKYNSFRKMQDYHDILSILLTRVYDLQGTRCGIVGSLSNNGQVKPVIWKISVQAFMGDAMGLNKLCLFKGSFHSKRLCRDCDVPPDRSDDPYYTCKFIKSNDLKHLRTRIEYNELCLHKMKNATSALYFGARDMCIFQSTPSEPLHAILLGLFKYLFEYFQEVIPKSCMRLIDVVVHHYYNKFSKQSNKDFPSLAPFQNGLTNCDVLGAKEQRARIFAVYISMMNREVIASLISTKRDIYNEETMSSKKIDALSISDVKEWFDLFESSLILYEWIMHPSHKRSNFSVPNNATDSPAQTSIRAFMHQFKSKVEGRRGHGVRILKFHQLLHYTREIMKDGSVQNIDTGRCESIAVTMYKRIAIWTQLRQTKLTSQLAKRHLECVATSEVIRIESKKKACSKISFASQKNESKERPTGLGGSTFKLNLVDSMDEHHEDSYLNKTIAVDWQGVGVNIGYHSNILRNLTKRLFFNTGHGGCLHHSSVPIGKTEYIDTNNVLYRAHPNYRSDGQWHDWCKIQWETDGPYVPAKIIMFLDLTECRMMTREEQDHMTRNIETEINDMNNISVNRTFIRPSEHKEYLEPDLWVVVRSAISENDEEDIRNRLPRNERKLTMTSLIASRILLETNCRLIKAESIEGVRYVLPTSYSQTSDQCDEYFSVEDIQKWHEMFIK